MLMKSTSNRLALPEDERPPEMIAAPGATAQAGLLHVVWRGRWILLVTTVAGLLGGWIYLLKAVPYFESTSRLYVQQSLPRILSEAQLPSGGRTYLNTQGELLRSTPVIASALERGGKQFKSFSGVDNGVAFIKQNLTVTVGKNDDLIAVSLESPYPDEAAALVNHVVDAYVEYQSRQRQSTAAEVLRILQKEKEKRELERADYLRKMLDFKRQNGALSFQTDKGNIVTERLARLSDAWTHAQLATVEAKAAHESVKNLKDDFQIQKVAIASGFKGSQPTFSSHVQAEIWNLEKELDQLRRSYGENHPALQAKESALIWARRKEQEQIQQYREGTLEAARETSEIYLASLKQTLDLATTKEREIEKSFNEQQKAALALNEKSAEYTSLQSEWQRVERLCELLDTRIKELNVTDDTAALNINILEVARPGISPVRPHRSRVLAVAAALGLLGGIGASMLRDLLDQRLRSADEIRALVGRPVLGVIPHMPDKGSVMARGQKVHLAKNSDVAEAYRTVRTAIYFGVPVGEAKRILVTSPAPGDGKTTCASNLAIAIAQSGQRVVLLDADFRKPTLHRVFDLSKEIGLSSVLAGQETLERSVQRTPVEGLDLLPCGPLPPNPAEIINSQAFSDLLDDLAQRYDHIVIDSPPVAPVTDARILGALCDLTVLVLRAEKSTRKLTEHAADALLSTGARILGVIVNDVPRGRGRYGYYDGYGYRYGYGYGQADEVLDETNEAGGQKLLEGTEVGTSAGTSAR